MSRNKRRASRPRGLSLERLESRILLAAVNPNEPAVLFGGDQLYFIQGESDEDDFPASDIGGEPNEDWVIIVSFEGPGSVRLFDSQGNNFIPLIVDDPILEDFAGKIGDIWFYDTTEDSHLFIQAGEWQGDFGLDDWVPGVVDISDMTWYLLDGDTGYYDWGSDLDTPFMDFYTQAGDRVNVFGPDGSGPAVVTGDMYFDDSCVGFGTLALDGSLKGSIGVDSLGFGLDTNETLKEVRAGYVHGLQFDFQGMTIGGLDMGGNVDRFIVKSSIAQPDDDGVNRENVSDRWGPAQFSVDGHLIELQASGTIYANITVGGASTSSPLFDADYRAWTGAGDNPHYSGGEFYEGGFDTGFLNDGPDSAFIVGSPTGSFAIEGNIYRLLGDPVDPQDKWDDEDWYMFNPGLGNEITVGMDYADWMHVFVFSPSGRLVSVVTPEEPDTFLAHEGGNYYIMAGRIRDDIDRFIPTGMSSDYRLTVSGAMHVGLGGVRAGSNSFNDSGAFTVPLELGDDVSLTFIDVATSIGSLEVLNDGIFGSVFVTVGEDLGYVSGGETTVFAPSFFVEGNLGRLEMTLAQTDPAVAVEFLFGNIDIGGNLGEIYTAAQLGEDNSTLGGIINVGGHVGSVVTEGGFYAQMTVGTTVGAEGLDFFYVGGDFGGRVTRSRLDLGWGADVAFAHVVGNIYHSGILVPPGIVSGAPLQFVDDGGARITLTPQNTRPIVKDIFGNSLVPDAGFTYRHLLIGRPGGSPAGSVLTEIVANDALSVTVESGRADLPYIRFDPAAIPSPFVFMPEFSLTVKGGDPLAELDVYFVDVMGGAGFISSIKNISNQGDIVNVFAASVGQIFADGHIGLTERYAPEVGRLPNPTPQLFGPHTLLPAAGTARAALAVLGVNSADQVFLLDPSLDYVFADGGLYYATNEVDRYTTALVSEDSLRYWNGVAVSGGIGRIEANGSIGDVYAGLAIGRFIADADGRDSGSRFSFEGVQRGALTWDGIAGTVYAGFFGIGFLDPGDGLFGGRGGTAIGGVFTDGEISRISASDSVISGPIQALNGIGRFSGKSTMLYEASIGTGVPYADWVMWTDFQAQDFSFNADLERLELKGTGSGIYSSMIQVGGALDRLYLDARSSGMVDSHIWVVGDPLTLEGINSIDIRGGNLSGSGAPPYGGTKIEDEHMRLMDIVSTQHIGSIRLRGPGDMIDMDIMSFKSIDDIDVAGDIASTISSVITAAWSSESISADNFIGPGAIDIAAGRLGELRARGNLEADLNIDGPVEDARVGGYFWGDVAILGPNGSLDSLQVGRDLVGSLSVGNSIGTIDVRNGDVYADIMAGGSTPENLAIGQIRVRNGDLIGNVSTYVNPLTLRPAGGIGRVYVSGDIQGDITARSYYDPVRGNRVTAHILLIDVRNGDLDGDVTIQQDNPFNPLDPGGDLLALSVRNGDLNGDVGVAGDIATLTIRNGSLNGDVTVTGSDVGRMTISSNGSPAVTGDIDIEGNLDYIKATGGVFDGSLTVGGILGMFYSGGAVLQPVEANYIGRMDLRSGSGSGGTVTSWTGLELMQSRGDVSGDVSVIGTVGQVKLRGGDLDAELDVDGDVQLLEIKGGRVSSNADPSDPRIELTGNVGAIRIYRYGGGGAVLDDEVYVGDELTLFQVRDGDFAGTLEAGTIGTAIYDCPNGVTGEIISHGNLDLLRVQGGPINAPVTVYHHAGRIDARGGVTVNGDMTIGSGFPGSGLDELRVRGGNMEGDLSVGGNLLQVDVRGHLNGSQITVTDNFGALDVRGDLLNADIAVGLGLGDVYVAGSYADTNINANALTLVKVRGTLGSATPHEIHANTGSFDLSVSGLLYNITDPGGVWIDGVHAYVG